MLQTPAPTRPPVAGGRVMPAAEVTEPDAPAAPAPPGERGLVEHIQSLRRYARALVGNHADADDLVQETLKRALVYVSGKKDIENLRSYLFTILHNVRIDALKRRQREGAQVPVEDTPLISASASQSESLACQQVLDAIQRLSEEHRQVLLLVGVEGMTYRETADVLELAMGTVMSRLNRARAALRKELDLHDDDPLQIDPGA